METHDKDDHLLSEGRTDTPVSPGRRAFMAFAGVTAGATLLGASRAAVAANENSPIPPAFGGLP
jgi:hypothetical protein